MRPPHPEHTTSSVRLLTEDRETENADCVQEGRGPLTTCGHRQRAKVKDAIFSTSLQTQVSPRQKAQGYRHQACSDSLLLAQQKSASWELSAAWGEAAELPCAEESSRLPTHLLLVSS